MQSPLYREEWHGVVGTAQSNKRLVSRGESVRLPKGACSEGSTVCLGLGQWELGEEPRIWYKCVGGEVSGRDGEIETPSVGNRDRSHCSWLSKAILDRR